MTLQLVIAVLAVLCVHQLSTGTESNVAMDAIQKYFVYSIQHTGFKAGSESAAAAGGRTGDGRGMGNSNNALEPGIRPTLPYFDKSASGNVTALLGKTAYLNCRVRGLGNKTVSWIRHRDVHLLTVGTFTYTNDQRFRATHTGVSEDWGLQLKYPQHRDAGIYECQVSTEPHMSHFVHLSVIEPTTEILGGPDLYIGRGSTINLTCVIQHSPEAPAFVFWNHNEAMISYDSERGGVSVATVKGPTTVSVLLIRDARASDSGQYKCSPSNSKDKTVTVHVLNGEHPAAMQHGGQAHHRSSHLYCLIFCVCLLLLVA